MMFGAGVKRNFKHLVTLRVQKELSS